MYYNLFSPLLAITLGFEMFALIALAAVIVIAIVVIVILSKRQVNPNEEDNDFEDIDALIVSESKGIAKPKKDRDVELDSDDEIGLVEPLNDSQEEIVLEETGSDEIAGTVEEDEDTIESEEIEDEEEEIIPEPQEIEVALEPQETVIAEDARYIISETQVDGETKYQFDLIDDKGTKLFQSQPYASPQGCKIAITTFKKNISENELEIEKTDNNTFRYSLRKGRTTYAGRELATEAEAVADAQAVKDFSQTEVIV